MDSSSGDGWTHLSLSKVAPLSLLEISGEQIVDVVGAERLSHYPLRGQTEVTICEGSERGEKE